MARAMRLLTLGDHEGVSLGERSDVEESVPAPPILIPSALRLRTDFPSLSTRPRRGLPSPSSLRPTHTFSVSISLKLGILPAMILQKMQLSSV